MSGTRVPPAGPVALPGGQRISGGPATAAIEDGT